MATKLFSVDNDLKWGRLVTAWALREPLPEFGNTAPTPPTTLVELKEQCTRMGFSVTIPDYLTSITILPGKKDTLTIRLPAADLVTEVRQDFAGNSTYALPEFYDDLYGHRPVPLTTVDKKIQLQTNRIGDYAIGMCQ